MDVRFALTSLALALSLLMSGCSEKTDEEQQAAFKAKAEQFEKKLETIQDPKLKEEITDLGGSLLMLDQIKLEMQKKPIETDYSEDSLALLKDYPAPQAVTDTYINGLFVQRKSSDSDTLTTLEPVFPFTFHSPTEFPFPHNLSWQSVTLDNKTTIPFAKERVEDSTSIQLTPSLYDTTSPNDLDLIYPYKEGTPPLNAKTKPNPVTLNGEIQVVTPRKVSTFEFSKKDVGTQRTDDSITVTLLALDKNYAEVEVQNSASLSDELIDEDFNPLIIQAQDKTRQFLSRSGGVTLNATQIAFYEKQLAALMDQKQYSEAFQNQLDADLHAFNQKQKNHYAKMYFNGLIDRVQVSVLDYSQTNISKTELSVPVRQFDEHTFGLTIQPLPLPVVVYDAQIEDRLKTYDLSEEQLKKSIVIHQDVDNPLDAKIKFNHPRTFSDEMRSSLFGAGENLISFYAQGQDGKPGNEIELPFDAYEVDVLEGEISYDLSKFPQPPAYALGTMPFYLGHIEKSFMDVGNLPKGLTLTGNALIIDQAQFPHEKWRFYGKDSKGKYLKEVLSVSQQAKKNSPMFDVHYFYGEPASLEAYQRTHAKRISLAFKVKLDKPSAASLEELDQTTSVGPDADE